MGSNSSKHKKRVPSQEKRRNQGWHGLLSNIGISFTDGLRHLGPPVLATQGMVLGSGAPIPEDLLPPGHSPQKPGMESTLPGFISVFLPEFQHRTFTGQDDFQILGFIAKGSFGPILKVKDRSKEKTYAVKVLPKSEILKHGVLEQSKEEVIIQRQLSHPFLHNLQDCWQTQRHLFIMCEYCSTGDLYTYWILKGQFGDDEVRVFAAELGCALGFLHDFGIMHRDVKMENVLLSDQGHLRLADFGLSRRLERGARAFTICGTIQYMAPEVLSGGPYSHAADWWSLGILLFSMVTGKFPVPPEPDHCNMLRKVRDCPYSIPKTFRPALALLLTELLCKNPAHRLHSLERFKRQMFFHGTSFDSQLLQKRPVELILELKNHPDRPVKAMRGLSMDYFQNFDCDILHSPTSPTDLSPTLANIDLSQALATAQGCSE
ncbi:ribosomal protein S6 kinase-related protein [Oncorhynchus keta]|uniref:ribosomal protein S6 kinase-related protein n=1 Tax=Oncorhynchus keta TaxID=8018 RepID=UPI0015FE5296|nr:ribosomal protein S6 kinase-related protein [Oncorhynchus keta]